MYAAEHEVLGRLVLLARLDPEGVVLGEQSQQNRGAAIARGSLLQAMPV